MGQRSGKPKKWEWFASVGMMLAGLFLQLSFFPDILRTRISPLLLGSGILFFLVLFISKEKFDDLPLEEQKERERMDRDERNQMLYGKTAWLCWRGETVLFFLGYITTALFWDKIEFLNRLDYRSVRLFNLLILVFWVRLLIFELVRWWLNRKY